MPINACVRPAAVIFIERDIEGCYVDGKTSPFGDIIQKCTEMKNGFTVIIASPHPPNEDTLPSDQPDSLVILQSVSNVPQLCWALKDPRVPLRGVPFERMLLVTIRERFAQLAQQYGLQSLFVETVQELAACERQLCELAKLHH